MAQIKTTVSSGSFKKSGSSARVVTVPTDGRTRVAAGSYIAMSHKKSDHNLVNLVVHMADPRVPEAPTQTIHRAMELSALSEVGQVIVDQHAGLIYKSKTDVSTTGDAVFVYSDAQGSGTPATTTVFENTTTHVYNASISQNAVKDVKNLARKYRELREEFKELGLVIVSTMRVRDERFGDRRVQVEYFQDPELQGSVLMRLTPTTSLVHAMPNTGRSVAGSAKPVSAKKASSVDEATHHGLEAAPALSTQRGAVLRDPDALIRTTEAAELLGVSRTYVAKLCDLDVFGPVEKTEGGQRRIPYGAVIAYQKQRRIQSQALDKMASSDISAQARAKEREAAEQELAARGMRWTKIVSKPSPSTAPAASVPVSAKKGPIKRAGAKKVEASKNSAGKGERA